MYIHKKGAQKCSALAEFFNMSTQFYANHYFQDLNIVNFTVLKQCYTERKKEATEVIISRLKTTFS